FRDGDGGADEGTGHPLDRAEGRSGADEGRSGADGDRPGGKLRQVRIVPLDLGVELFADRTIGRVVEAGSDDGGAHGLHAGPVGARVSHSERITAHRGRLYSTGAGG